MYRLSGFADEIDASLDTQIEVIKKLGMEWIECRGVDGSPLISYSLSDAEKIKSKLDDAGIKLSSVGSSIGKIGIGDDFAPHFDLFRHTCDIAKLFGTRNIRMFSFFIPEGVNPEKYEDEVMRMTSSFCFPGDCPLHSLHYQTWLCMTSARGEAWF